MKNYIAIVTEETAPNKGQIIANTKSSIQYKGMTKKQFIEATKYISAHTITIKEMN
jgi:predicted RNA-binding protein with EMAP domain